MKTVEELTSLLEAALARIAVLEAENADLRRRLEAEEFRGRVAPFRREPRRRKQSRGVPGRPAGHAPAGRPDPCGPFDEHHEASVPVACPACGAADLGEPVAVDEFVEELPDPRPFVTRVRSWRCTCRACGGQVASAHALSPSGGRPGAVRTRLGPRARALAAALTRTGMTTRKAVQVLRDAAGLRVSPGAVVHSNHRLARDLRPRYDALLEELRGAPALHADETGWWMDGKPRTLCVVCSPSATHYSVTPSRTRAFVRSLVGGGFKGVLVTDCLSIYDGVNELQQKCYAHHLRAVAKAMERAPESGQLEGIKQMLLDAMDLAREPRGPARDAARRELKERAGRLLFQQPAAGEAEKKVRTRLRKQHDHLFTFLDHDGVDATNNLAERQLRPAVVTRKLSAGNKTERGAATWAVLTSLAATARQRGSSPVDALMPAQTRAPNR